MDDKERRAPAIFGQLYSGLQALTPLAGYIASRQQVHLEERFRQIIRSLGRSLKRLEGRVRNLEDDPYLGEVFDSLGVVALRNGSAEKLNAAGAIAAHYTLKVGDPEHIRFQQTDFLLRALEALAVDSLTVLKVAARHAERATPRKDLRRENVRVDFHVLQRSLPDLDANYLMGLVSDLDRFNLLHKLGSPPNRAEYYGNYPIEVTPIGAQLVKQFLSE